MAHATGSPWPRVVGIFAFLLGAAIAVGALFPADADLPPDLLGLGPSSQAMHFKELAVGTGFFLGAAGLCLIGGLAFGRALFFWGTPLGAVTLASNHPELLWPEDIPYTVLGVVLFAPFAFSLSRSRAQATFGRGGDGWAARGGGNALACLVVYGGLYAWVASMPAASGGPEWPGFEHLGRRGAGFHGGLSAANLYVAKKATALVLLAHAAGAFLAVSIPSRARPAAAPSSPPSGTQPPPVPRKETSMSTTRDEFRLIGFMKFYLVIQILAPLFLIGLTAWAVNQPGLELAKAGPLILAGFAAWAIYEFVRLVKWSGFAVTVTDTDITVGKTRVAWTDVAGAKVQAAIKLDTWLEIRPRTGEPLKIPAAIGNKDLLLTLVEKHHPELVRK